MITAVPFSTPGLAVLDSVRALLTAFGFLLVGAYLIRRWPDTGSHHERSRVLGMALALFILASSRITNLGGDLGWQLPASALVFLLVGFSVLRPWRGRSRRR